MPYLAGGESFAEAVWIDVGGDGSQQTFIDPADDTFKCVYETEAFKDMVIRTGRFYNEGLVYRDSSTAQDYGATQIKNGVGSVFSNSMASNAEETLTGSCGYPMTVKRFESAQTKLGTSSFNKFGWAVPVTAKEPEAAVKFINLLYTENVVHDTLVWGEEGVDWVRNADGTAAYPNGGDSADYHMNDFMYGNILTVPNWGGDPNLRTYQRESNAALEASKYVGFAVDNTPVLNLVTACQNVTNTYKPLLASGAYGDQTEAKLQEYIDALYAAGMGDVLAEYQSQLDAWLAAQ